LNEFLRTLDLDTHFTVLQERIRANVSDAPIDASSWNN